MNIDELKNLIKGGIFNSPTKGTLDLDTVVSELINFRKEYPDNKYNIVIGTDSDKREQEIEFVCVVAIHRIGKGGRYFWLKIFDNRNLDLRSRIYQEATISLALAWALLDGGIILHDELEIHVDIGQNGPTREMIKEIKGMISGSGFFVKIKPEAFAASTLADRHT